MKSGIVKCDLRWCRIADELLGRLSPKNELDVVVLKDLECSSEYNNTMREVLTFQLGNYSNYIGAHWWNIQESYFQYDERNPSDIYHDVLFREGKTFKGQVTFTPRLLLVDRAENMLNVPILNENPIKSDRSSATDIEIQEQPTQEKHEFIRDLEQIERGQRVNIRKKNYNFDETIRTWSDYLRTRYHPRSVCAVQNSFPNDIFNNGIDMYQSLEEEIIERTRSYLEECDNLQGFQLLVDANDAFGGLAHQILIHLQDEYSRKAILTVPAISGVYANSSPMDDIKRTLNIFLTYQKLTENSSLMVPLGTNRQAWRTLGPPTSFPHIIYNHSNSYHTSAILASFLDTVSLKYRLREDYILMEDLISGLNYYNKKLCAATMSLPFPMAPNAFLLDTLENMDDSLPLWSQLTPGCNVTDDTIFYQKITVRGIPNTRMKNPSDSQANTRVSSCSNLEELVHLYLSYRLTTVSDVTSVKLPLKTDIPYPQIFSPHVSPSGDVDETSTRMENYSVNSCPAITGLHCCKALGQMVDSLHRTVKGINIKRFFQFFGGHMDLDEFNESLEKLLAMGFGQASEYELR